MRLSGTAIAALLAGAATTHADQIDWSAPGDGIFQDASNWFPAEVPDANDLVVLNQPVANTTITFTGDVETLAMEMDAGTFTLDLGGYTFALNDSIAPLNFVGPDPYDLTMRNGTMSAYSADAFAPGTWTIGESSMIELVRLTVWGGATTVVADQGVAAVDTLAEGGSRVTVKPDATLRLEPGSALRTRRLFVEKLQAFTGDPLTGHFDQQGGSTWVSATLDARGLVSVQGGLFVLGDAAPPGVTSGFVMNDPEAQIIVVGGPIDIADDAYFVSGTPFLLDFNDTISVGGSLYVGGFGGPGMEIGAKGGVFEVGDRLVVGDGGSVVNSTSTMAVTDLEIDGGDIGLTSNASIRVGADAAPAAGLIVDGPGPATAFVRGSLETTGGIIVADSAGGQGTVIATGMNSVLDGRFVRIGSNDGTSQTALLRVEDGATMYSTEALVVNEAGELRLDAGTVFAFSDVSVLGTVAGAGVIHGSVVNTGVVRPGASVGLVRLAACGGTYTQTPDGALEIEIAGFAPSEHDRIEVEGPVMLDGALRLTLLDGFAPEATQGFEIIKITDGGGQGLTGTFATIEPAGWDALYFGDRVVVTYEDPCPADIDDSGVVGFADLLLLVAQWGACPANCPWDLDDSDQVGFSDLQVLLQAWGPCPGDET